MRGVYYLGNEGTGADREHILLEAPVVAVDVETISLEDKTILGIGFSPNKSESFYYPIDCPYIPYNILFNPAQTKIFHNGHFDIKLLEEKFSTRVAPIEDTMIMAQLCGYPMALHDFVLEVWNINLTTIEDLLGPRGKKQKTMDSIPREQVALKCCNDTRYTFAIWEKLRSNVPQAAYRLEMEYLPLILDIERRGLLIDEARLEQHTKQVQRLRDYYRGVCRGMGFNPGSSQQVAAMLQYKGWPIRYNKHTGKPICNKEILQEFYWDDPIAQLTVLYRQQNILLSTFLKALPEKYIDPDGRVRGSISQTNVVSGRTSRSRPNLQNQPPALRDIFIASPGNLIEERDLSQIELREFAYKMKVEANDPTMFNLYEQELKTNPPTIADIHQETGTRVSRDRRTGKTLNFAVVYLGDEHTLWTKQRIPLAEGWQLVRDFEEAYPGFIRLVKQTEEKILQLGYTETRLGRRRYFKSEDLATPERYKASIREGFNHEIQGSAGELLKILQLRLKDYPQVNMVHDSIEFDRSVGLEIPKDISVGLAPYRTPIEIKIGPNWGEAKVEGIFGEGGQYQDKQ